MLGDIVRYLKRLFVFGLATSLALGALGCDQVFGLDRPTTAEGRAVVFDNGPSATDLIDIPVMVPLDRVGTTVPDPFTDLRFHDPRTDQDLPFEIDHWDPAGESIVWVRVPRIAARSTTDRILMYSGPDAGGAEAAAATWQGYDAVVHGDRLRDSTGLHAASAIGVVTSTGTIGDAIQFAEPDDQRVTFAQGGALFNAWPTFSLEMWIYLDYATTNLGGNEPGVFNKTGALTGGRLLAPGGQIRLQVDVQFASRATSYMQVVLAQQIWTHYILSYDGSRVWCYVDGELIADDAGASSSLPIANEAFFLGHQSAGFRGALDEVRVSQAHVNPDRAVAQYRMMTRQFVTFEAL